MAADTSSDIVRDDWTKDKIVLGAQNAQEIKENIEKTLAAEVIHHRRALRSH